VFHAGGDQARPLRKEMERESIADIYRLKKRENIWTVAQEAKVKSDQRLINSGVQ
jgi:hypothetical protein